MMWHQVAPTCQSCRSTMRPLQISANSQAQIQIAFKCFRCTTSLTLTYDILKLREWSEQLDGVTKTLQSTADDDAFLRDMKIKPMKEV